jgi:hypothetical protein
MPLAAILRAAKAHRKQAPWAAIFDPGAKSPHLWRYTDNEHFYYLALKTNGWEVAFLGYVEASIATDPMTGIVATGSSGVSDTLVGGAGNDSLSGLGGNEVIGNRFAEVGAGLALRIYEPLRVVFRVEGVNKFVSGIADYTYCRALVEYAVQF